MSDTTVPAPRNALRAAQLKELRSFARRFRSLPLTDAEAARVANNVMPYLR